MCSFVCELTAVEGLQLSRILKTSNNVVMLRRAQVVAFSGQGMQAKHIAKQLCLRPAAGERPIPCSRRRRARQMFGSSCSAR